MRDHVFLMIIKKFTYVVEAGSRIACMMISPVNAPQTFVATDDLALLLLPLPLWFGFRKEKILLLEIDRFKAIGPSQETNYTWLLFTSV